MNKFISIKDRLPEISFTGKKPAIIFWEEGFEGYELGWYRENNFWCMRKGKMVIIENVTDWNYITSQTDKE